ncbi:MAG: tyrosine decarboxylase MfnA [Candidatus Heimdallarchaeota archaeon]
MQKQQANITDKIIAEISELLANEKSYQHVLSSMCTPPKDILRTIAGLFAEINLGDPGLFPMAVEMEQDVLAELASLLNAPQGWVGTITSGGSESNLLGCWAARNWARKKKKIQKGTILLPLSAHVSFEKARDILDVKAKWIGLDEHFQMDITRVQEAITKDTFGIVGIAGTTGTGVCDNIKALSDLAEDHELFLHVDAAHGGTIFPFLSELGLSAPSFAFENPGVKSIGVDTHKMMGGLIPGGSIIFREKTYTEAIAKNISYLSDSSTQQLTVTGTRPGNSVIASWVLLKKLGREYMLERVRSCMENTAYFVHQLEQLKEIKLPFQPTINIIGFRCTSIANEELAMNLRKKGWALSIYDQWLRIVVMPHVSKETIDLFVADLKKSIQGER